MHAISSYRGNRPTLPAHPPGRPSATDRGDYNTPRRSLAHSVNYESDVRLFADS